MRIKTVFVFSFVLFLVACTSSSVTFLGGERKNLNEFKGRLLLINYWAAWCKPCLTEIPELNAFNLRQDVNILAYNYDGLEETILKAQVKKFDIQYRSIINNPSLLYKQNKPSGLPATMVINAKGEFVEWLYGAQDQDSLLKLLN